MVQIGTWKKTQTAKGISHHWENSKNVLIKVFKHPNGDWNVTVKRPKHLFENLLGGKSKKEDQSYGNALTIAYKYMNEHP